MCTTLDCWCCCGWWWLAGADDLASGGAGGGVAHDWARRSSALSGEGSSTVMAPA